MSFGWQWRRKTRKLIHGNYYYDNNGGECLLQFVANRHREFKGSEWPGFFLGNHLDIRELERAWDIIPFFGKQLLIMIQNEQFYRSFGSMAVSLEPRQKQEAAACFC